MPKVLFLTGAGFTASANFGGVSTWQLTNKLRNLEIAVIGDIDGMRPGEYFYRLLTLHYTGEKTGDCDLGIVNFETIVHLLEEIHTFLVSGKDKGKNRFRAEYKGIKPTFLNFKSKIKKDLFSLKLFAGKDSLYSTIKIIHDSFINAIIDELVPFNNDAENVGMKDFQSNFLNKYFDKEWTKRFYTLNYDDWIHRYLGYYDGFNSGLFDPDTVLINSELDCHYNVHGCIYWRNTIDTNRVEKLSKPVKVLNYSVASTFGITREALINSPIITGYNKSPRMQYNPYLQFYYSLQKDIIDADLLVIIGYAFSDTHINNLLALYKGRTVCVNYLKNWMQSEEKFNEINNDPIKKRAFENEHGPLTKMEWSYDKFDPITLEFLGQIEPAGNGFNHISERQLVKGWINSENGKTSVWWKGIGEDFYNNWNEIIK